MQKILGSYHIDAKDSAQSRINGTSDPQSEVTCA